MNSLMIELLEILENQRNKDLARQVQGDQVGWVMFFDRPNILAPEQVLLAMEHHGWVEHEHVGGALKWRISVDGVSRLLDKDEDGRVKAQGERLVERYLSGLNQSELGELFMVMSAPEITREIWLEKIVDQMRSWHGHSM